MRHADRWGGNYREGDVKRAQWRQRGEGREEGGMEGGCKYNTKGGRGRERRRVGGLEGREEGRERGKQGGQEGCWIRQGYSLKMNNKRGERRKGGATQQGGNRESRNGNAVRGRMD